MALLGKADWLLRIVTSWPAIYFAFLFSFITHAINNMVGGTLFTYPDNFRAQKAEIAAKYSGAKLTVSKDFKFGETNKSAEFLKKFPLGKVPAFEGSDGTLLTESNAIAYYVANEELRGGSDAAARPQVVQWMSMADSDILPAACTWVFPTMGIMQFNKNATERAKEDIKGVLKALNDHLLAKTFLVGERISLADIAVACTLLSLYKQVMDPAFRGAFGNVNRWFTTVVNQPNAKAVLGEVVLCTKEAQFDAKKFAESLARATRRKRRSPRRSSLPRRSPRRRKRSPLRLPRRRTMACPRSQRPRIPWLLFPRAPSTWRNGRGSIPTTTRTIPSSGSVNTSTPSTIPSGGATTSSTTSSPWSSCPATSSEACSSVLRI